MAQTKTMAKNQDAALASSAGEVIQGLAFLPGWGEKNFQVPRNFFMPLPALEP